MTEVLFTISLFIGVIMLISLFLNYTNKRIKKLILFGPLLTGLVIYLLFILIGLFTGKESCDGGLLALLLIGVFMLGIGLLVNIINLLIKLLRKVWNKNNKGKYLVLAVGLILVGFILVKFKKTTSINEKISRDLDLYIPKSLEFTYEDSHGGFHGDGETLAKVKLKEDELEDIIKKSKHKMKKSRLPKNLDKFIFGDRYYEGNIGEKLVIPDLDVVYWIFLDRWGGQGNHYNEGESLFLESRFSANFSLAIIDLNTNILYYIKYDS